MSLDAGKRARRRSPSYARSEFSERTPGGKGCLDHEIRICLHKLVNTPQHHSRSEYIGTGLDALSIQATRYLIGVNELEVSLLCGKILVSERRLAGTVRTRNDNDVRHRRSQHPITLLHLLRLHINLLAHLAEFLRHRRHAVLDHA